MTSPSSSASTPSKNPLPSTATALIAQIQAEHPLAKQLDCCRGCFTPSLVASAAGGKGSGLKRCNGCKIISYCSRDCQRKDWDKHRFFCHLVQGGKKWPTSAYFDERPEVVVFALLRDAYRLRMRLDFEQGKRAGAKGSRVGFRRFLDQAEKAGERTVLPGWWSGGKRKECEAFATRRGDESNVEHAVEFDECRETHMDPSVDTALLIIAEKVCGFDGAEGSPGDRQAWLQRFAQNLDTDPDAKAALQRDGLDRMSARVAKDKRANPGRPSMQDMMKEGGVRGPEDMNEQGRQMFEQMMKTFDPHNGNGANFEAFKRTAEQMAPDNKELHASFKEIAAEHYSSSR